MGVSQTSPGKDLRQSSVQFSRSFLSFSNHSLPPPNLSPEFLFKLAAQAYAPTNARYSKRKHFKNGHKKKKSPHANPPHKGST